MYDLWVAYVKYFTLFIFYKWKRKRSLTRLPHINDNSIILQFQKVLNKLSVSHKPPRDREVFTISFADMCISGWEGAALLLKYEYHIEIKGDDYKTLAIMCDD